jgi:nucleotide-binding universal stress UspA family protein
MEEYVMVEFSKILFPIDFSGIGVKISPYVRMMATRHQAKVEVLHVLEITSEYTGLVEAHVDLDQIMENMERGAEQKLAQIAEEHLAGLPEVSTVLLKGRPGQEIRDYAKNNRIDLIIMASHARKGLDYVFFGSVAHKVTRTPDVPVLLINPSKVEAG